MFTDWLTEMKYHDNEIGMNKIDNISFNSQLSWMCVCVCMLFDTVKNREKNTGFCLFFPIIFLPW